MGKDIGICVGDESRKSLGTDICGSQLCHFLLGQVMAHFYFAYFPAAAYSRQKAASRNHGSLLQSWQKKLLIKLKHSVNNPYMTVRQMSSSWVQLAISVLDRNYLFSFVVLNLTTPCNSLGTRGEALRISPVPIYSYCTSSWGDFDIQKKHSFHWLNRQAKTSI